jgi:hypothetical protein
MRLGFVQAPAKGKIGLGFVFGCNLYQLRHVLCQQLALFTAFRGVLTGERQNALVK